MSALVAGVDFGTDSVRIIFLNTENGNKESEAVCSYRRWEEGKYCQVLENVFRQHPLDYLESFETAFKKALKEAGNRAAKWLKGIAVDTTGSTPVAVDRTGTPLSLSSSFKEEPDAMFILWKDHSAVTEAAEVNTIFSDWKGTNYTKFQGTYSAEWYWAKILHICRTNLRVKKAAWAWVEHCDWFPSMLTGNTKPETMYRGACAAGHKALWHSEFGGLPNSECLYSLDPVLAATASRYSEFPKPAGTCLGTLTPEWSERLGISSDVVVGGGSFDAHSGAVGAGITPQTLVKVMGTSTVDMLIEKPNNLTGKNLSRLCGQAENSIIPGFVGIETGQSAFGDIYAWFRKLLIWPTETILMNSSLLTREQKENLYNELYSKMLPVLENEILQFENTPLISLDWFNGRRYPDLNEKVKSAITGLSLGTTAPQIYKSLLLSSIFGSKRIFDGLISQGIKINKIIAVGGIAKKSPVIMQLMADIINRPIIVAKEEQVCAKGAALFAAVAAGLFSDIQHAQATLCKDYERVYKPNLTQQKKYIFLYKKYLALGNYMEIDHTY